MSGTGEAREALGAYVGWHWALGYHRALIEETKGAAMQDFEGKVAVVTGAASGMGRAFAERFAEEGMKVVLSDVEEPALEAAVAELRQRELEVASLRTWPRRLRWRRWPRRR